MFWNWQGWSFELISWKEHFGIEIKNVFEWKLKGKTAMIIIGICKRFLTENEETSKGKLIEIGSTKFWI